MTENAKKFMEFLSAQDEETKATVYKMEKSELTTYAAGKGFILMEAE